MNNWTRLVNLLDQTIGFPNRISSTVKKVWQGYDQHKGEHVMVLHYRTKVNPGIRVPVKPLVPVQKPVHRDPQPSKPSVPMIRELLSPNRRSE